MSSENKTTAVESAGVLYPGRDLPAIARRVLIIGLDGATFDVLDPMMDAGRMPHLKAFVERGTAGVLESTKPPITPAAWTTFMTGKSPGTHGVIDFEQYDARSHRLVLTSQQTVAHVRTLWEIAGDKGLKVGAISVPMTYPARKVNGFMITGFGTPGIDSEFTYPPSLKAEILRRWPDFTFKTQWRRRVMGGLPVFEDNLRRFCRSFHQGAEITRHCGDTYGWDVLMVVYKLVDNLQHKTWRYLDPRFNQNHLRQAEMVAGCFKELDDALGNLFEYAEKNDASVMMVSDHGHGSLEGKIQANLLLKRWGYLNLQPPIVQSAARLRYIWNRSHRKGRQRIAENFQVTRDLAVDFSRTQACVMHAGEYGFLYLNMKGRQPVGIVEPGDYQRLREEIRERLLSMTTTAPDGKEFQLFTDVYRPEDVYDRPRSELHGMADLFLKPAAGFSVVRRIQGGKVVRWLPWRKIEGTHRAAGMFAIAGPGIARGRRTNADIIDCTPTILAMLGLRIPDDIEGRVIESMFDPPLRHETEAAGKGDAEKTDRTVYSEAEEQIIAERLADLGYLE